MAFFSHISKCIPSGYEVFNAQKFKTGMYAKKGITTSVPEEFS